MGNDTLSEQRACLKNIHAGSLRRETAGVERKAAVEAEVCGTAGSEYRRI